MELVLVYLLGMLAGLVVAWVIKPRPIGDLRIDHSDPDGPYLFLELETEPDSLRQRKEVVFRVKFKDYIPQK